MKDELQIELLTLAADCFPAFCRYKFKEIEAFNRKYPTIYAASRDDLWRAVKYLEGHSLLKLDSMCSISGGNEGITGYIQATSKGMDYLKRDGGLSADLNVVTIKFHKDAVVVLEDLIALSSIDDEQKKEAKSKVGTLSLEAAKAVVQAAATAGISAILGK